MSVVVRFAPSPTGHLHLGGVRTALFNWLHGRGAGGVVRLRIEDSDRARSSDEHAASIIEALEWLGLDWDGPVVRQSDRLDVYGAALERLVAEGKAYPCTCPPAELEKAREMARAAGRVWRYPGTCRGRTAPARPGEAHALRLRAEALPPPFVEDLLAGALNTGGAGLDDFVLTRSDGTPLYNLCCVVDDAAMGVTHVVRGADHIENTLKQAALYEALGLRRPVFAHLPLVTGLGKRLGSASVQSFRDRGLLPAAVLNYVARLGWSLGDEEVFDREALLRHFRLEAVGRSPGRVNEAKLLWLNERHLRSTPAAELRAMVRPFVKGEREREDPRLPAVAALLAPRVKTLAELAEEAAPYLAEDDAVPVAAREGAGSLEEGEPGLLEAVAAGLEGLEVFDETSVHCLLEAQRRARGLQMKQVGTPCRLALTGQAAGPRVVDIMMALGRESAASRLRRAACRSEAAGLAACREG